MKTWRRLLAMLVIIAILVASVMPGMAFSEENKNATYGSEEVISTNEEAEIVESKDLSLEEDGVTESVPSDTASESSYGIDDVTHVNASKGPSSVHFIESELEMRPGEEEDLLDYLVLTPDDAETTYSWKSSKKKVAKVDRDGVVTAIGSGTTKITVKTKNKKKSSIKITVPKNKITDLCNMPTRDDFDEVEGGWTLWPVSIEENSKGRIVCEFYLLNGTGEKSKRIQDMRISLAVGTPDNIVAETSFSKINVSCKNNKYKKFMLTFPAHTVMQKDVFFPDYENDIYFDIEETNSFGLRAGKGLYDFIPTVFPRQEPVAFSAYLSKENLKLLPGNSQTLTATIIPETTRIVSTTWTSSNPEIATVGQDGKIQAIQKGNATITVTIVSESGQIESRECIVTVDDEEDHHQSVPTDSVDVTSITLDRTAVSIIEGQTLSLNPTVLPENATDKSIRWISDNVAVATVSEDGEVQAVSTGNAIITAEAKDGSGVKAACEVTVNPKPVSGPVKVTSITLNQTTANITVGETLTLDPTVLPDNATDKSIKWSSDNETVATVTDDGLVKVVAIGNVTITAEAKDGSGVKAACVVTGIPYVKVTGITLDQTAVIIKQNQSLTLMPTLLPENASNKNIIWSSDNSQVATVKNGIVTAISEGSATITAQSADNEAISAICKVNVPSPVRVESIQLNTQELTLKAGDTQKITATVLPDNADNKRVLWYSDNEKVATVKDGNITAIDEGSAIITAKAEENDKIIATCKVSVDIIPISSIEISGPTEYRSFFDNSYGLFVGESITFIGTIEPKNATKKDLRWISSDNEVLSIDNKGKATAISSGTVKITAMAQDGSGISEEVEVSTYPECPIITECKFNSNDNSVYLVWNRAKGANHYRVEYGNDDTWEANKKCIDTYDLKCTIENLEPNTKYYFAVYAVGNNSESSSDYSYVTTGAQANPVPETPTNVKAVANNDGSVTVTWTKSSGCDGYKISYCKDDILPILSIHVDGANAQSGTIPAGARKYTITVAATIGIDPIETPNYQESEPSDVVTVIVKPPVDETFTIDSGNELTFTEEGGSKTVNVTSNTTWRAISDEDWLTVNDGMATSGQNNGAITFKAVENAGTADRTATVTFTYGENNKKIKLEVTQNRKEIDFYIDHAGESILKQGRRSGKGKMGEYAYNGDIYTLNIFSNMPWTVSADDTSWIKLPDKASYDAGQTDYVVELKNIKGGKIFKSALTFNVSGVEYTLNLVLDKEDQFSFYINHEADTILSVGNNNGSAALDSAAENKWTYTLTINSEVDWSFEGASDNWWLMFPTMTKYQAGETKFKMELMNIEGGEAYSSTLTFKARDQKYTVTLTLDKSKPAVKVGQPVVQNAYTGKAFTPEVTEDYNISKESVTFKINAENGCGKYQIIVIALDEKPDFSKNGENQKNDRIKSLFTDGYAYNNIYSADEYNSMVSNNGGGIPINFKGFAGGEYLKFAIGAFTHAKDTVPDNWTVFGLRIVRVPVESVSLNKSSLTLSPGQTASLTATVRPTNASNKSITWSSSNKNVATVKNGMVTAVGEGKTTITVSVDNGTKTDACVVNVNSIHVGLKLLSPTKEEDYIGISDGTMINTIKIAWAYNSLPKDAYIKVGLYPYYASEEEKEKYFVRITDDKQEFYFDGSNLTFDNRSLLCCADVRAYSKQGDCIDWAAQDIEIYAAKADYIDKPGVYSQRRISDLFESDNEVEDKDFIKLSCILSKEAYSEYNCMNYLNKLGFKNYRQLWYSSLEEHTVGVTFGQRTFYTKKGEKSRVYVIAMRGSEGNNEWISNFTIGLDGYHEGFERAYTNVLNAFSNYQYREEQADPVKQSNQKLWLTGHSRGGAVADMLAASPHIGFDKKNIYAYTFAAPKASVYGNMGIKYIFNYYNEGDIVPNVPMEGLGFSRIGRDIKVVNNGVFSQNYLNSGSLTKQITSRIYGLLNSRKNIMILRNAVVPVIKETPKDTQLSVIVKRVFKTSFKIAIAPIALGAYCADALNEKTMTKWLGKIDETHSIETYYALLSKMYGF